MNWKPGFRGRFWLAFLTTVTCSMNASAIDIALTNDDGWEAPGIQMLYEALVGAGHRVTLVAPAADQSGSGAAVSGGDLRIRRERADQFSVHACRSKDCTSLEPGKPATSAFIAIDVATRRAEGRPPALLVSGINAGANLGPVTPFSGTVGAAVAAISGARGLPVPAVAVSTDPPPMCKRELACEKAHYTEVAAFVVSLVGQLVRNAGHDGALLPHRLALNVNYPSVPPKGVRLAVQGEVMLFNGAPVRLSMGCPDCLESALGESAGVKGALEKGEEAAANVADSDVVLFSKGYITIVPITADHTARNARGLGWIRRLDVDVARQ